MSAERALGQFMDEYFYSKLSDSNGNSISYQRVTDQNYQLSGIDVIIEMQGQEYYIDEKATLYYSNTMLPTFAFEINFIPQFSLVPVSGWFLNNKLKTEYYMLIWPNTKRKKEKENGCFKMIPIKELHKNDFTIIEAMLISKSAIWEFLAKKQWPADRVLDYAKTIRGNNWEGKVPANVDDQAFSFHYSTKLAEKPINIVIRKEVLNKLATARFFISSEQYVKINS